ncbi:MAG TPA: hypothetical protein VJ761_15785, partial [Ktedonobacteraceae bacterium]|nr:hypothetical protein [Ktedonobacteraceae bacterium]
MARVVAVPVSSQRQGLIWIAVEKYGAVSSMVLHYPCWRLIGSQRSCNAATPLARLLSRDIGSVCRKKVLRN